MTGPSASDHRSGGAPLPPGVLRAVAEARRTQRQSKSVVSIAKSAMADAESLARTNQQIARASEVTARRAELTKGNLQALYGAGKLAHTWSASQSTAQMFTAKLHPAMRVRTRFADFAMSAVIFQEPPWARALSDLRRFTPSAFRPAAPVFAARFHPALRMHARFLGFAKQTAALSRVGRLVGPMLDAAAWFSQLPWLVIEAEAALAAYEAGDTKPMFAFMVNRLNIRNPDEDHAQALVVALFSKEWKQETDLGDARAVRLTLRRLAAAGDVREANHQVAGGRVDSLERLKARRFFRPESPMEGPEVTAIANLVSWADTFESRYVRWAVGRLDELETAVVRRYAEETYPNWREAARLDGQEAPGLSERVRRKLRRFGREIDRRQLLMGGEGQ